MSTTMIPFVQLDNASRSFTRPHGGLGSLLFIPSLWMARRRQRDALVDLAEDKRLLADIGLTREQALREAGKPFWR